MNLGLSFLKGMIAAVNPCAFVLLPTYLMYFLGLEAGRTDSPRASVRRALAVSGSVSGGFIGVFVVAGAISRFATTWLNANARYVTVVIGIALVVVGAAMLFGYRLPLATPRIDADRRDRTVRSMLVYGVAYALASISCTLPLFVSAMFLAGENDGILAGVVNGSAFGLGMALLVVALTVALAVANHAMLRVLRSAMRHVHTVAAAFVMLSGLYLVYYFWVVDVNNEIDGVTGAVESLQNRVLVQLNDNWQLAAIVLGGIVIAAIAYVSIRRRSTPGPTVASPLREPRG